MKERRRRKCGRMRIPWRPDSECPRRTATSSFSTSCARAAGRPSPSVTIEIMDGVKEMASTEGIFAAARRRRGTGCLQATVAEWISCEASDRVVLFNTGSGYKYLDVFAKYWGVEAFSGGGEAASLAEHRRNHRAVLAAVSTRQRARSILLRRRRYALLQIQTSNRGSCRLTATTNNCATTDS